MRIAIVLLSIVWKIYFGIFFLISIVLFYPIILPFLFSEKGKKRSFRLFVIWSWTVRLFGFYSVRKIKNFKPPNGPYIIVANHTSFLDIFLLPSILPFNPFLFLGKSEILMYPLLKTYFKRLNIPVYRGSGIRAARSLIKASKALKEGWSLAIFPEGGIPEYGHPKMIPFKNGAFQLAKSANVPIVPVTFLNNYRLLSEPKKILRPARPGRSDVFIHQYISIEEVQALSKKELNAKCFSIVNGPIVSSRKEM